MHIMLRMLRSFITVCFAFLGIVFIVYSLYGMTSPSLFFNETIHNIIAWDFGFTKYGVRVTDEAEMHFIRSLKLIIPAFLISMTIGVVKGIFMFMYRDTRLRNVWIIDRLLFGSLPDFIIFISVQYLLWVVMRYGFPRLDLMGHDQWYNPIFPTAILCIYPVVFLSHITYKSLLDDLPKDYIRTAYSKGTMEFKVVTKHLLWNSWATIFSYSQSIMLYIVTSLPVIELVAFYKGAGYLMITALKGEINLIIPLCLMFLMLMLVCTWFSDLCMYFLVPTAVENETSEKTIRKRRTIAAVYRSMKIQKPSFRFSKPSIRFSINVKKLFSIKMAFKFIKDYQVLSLGIFMLFILVFLAVLGPILPYVDESLEKMIYKVEDGGKITIPRVPAPPGDDFIFGSTRDGSDLFSILVLGTKETMLEMIAIISIRYLLAVPLGYWASFNRGAGFISGWLNGLLSFFPSIILIGMLSRTPVISNSEHRLYWMILIIALVEVGRVSEYFKQEFIGVRKNEYITSAIVAGTNSFQLLKRYYLPYLYQKFIYNFVMDMSRVLFLCGLLGLLSIYLEQTLYRLDTGQITYINQSLSWPFFLGNYLQDIRGAQWIPFYTSLFMTYTILALNIFAEGLQQFFDKKLRFLVSIKEKSFKTKKISKPSNMFLNNQ